MTKDDALIDLCKAFLDDPRLVSQPEWQKLVLIGEVGNGSTEIFGYSYDLDGRGKLTAPSNGVSTDKMLTLHGLMKSENPNGRGWLKCMIRISRAGEIGADFEYNDPKRWEHTTDNYLERIKEYATLAV